MTCLTCCCFIDQQFYVLNIFNGGQPLSEGELVAQLERITNGSDSSEEAVGVLTAAERTFWAKQRKRLLRGTVANKQTNKKTCKLSIQKGHLVKFTEHFDNLGSW